MMIIFCKFFDDRKKIVYTTSATHRDKIAYEWVQFQVLTDDIEADFNKRGFYRCIYVNEKPELLEDEELVYRMERRDGSYTKTYLKKSIYEDLPDDIDLPRKFSKLKLYGNCQSIGVWTTLVDWMKNTLTPNGINLKDAFDYAQEISEDHPLFSTYFQKAKEECKISDEIGKMILDNSVLADGENPPYDGSSDGIESNSSDSMVMKAQASIIPDRKFYRNSEIDEVIDEQSQTIGENAYYCCPNLKNVEFSSCKSIGRYAFMYCLNMNNVVLPECEEIGKCAFYGDKNLVEVSIPRCKRICNGAFQFCNKIEKITLNECECIERLAFSGCSNLKEIHLYGDKKVLLDKPNAFDGTSSELKIFVKESLYDEYIASDDWRKWSSMISIEES